MRAGTPHRVMATLRTTMHFVLSPPVLPDQCPVTLDPASEGGWRGGVVVGGGDQVDFDVLLPALDGGAGSHQHTDQEALVPPSVRWAEQLEIQFSAVELALQCVLQRRWSSIVRTLSGGPRILGSGA